MHAGVAFVASLLYVPICEARATLPASYTLENLLRKILQRLVEAFDFITRLEERETEKIRELTTLYDS